MRFRDRVALVTGGARGIGQVIAQRLAQEGATVAIVDLLAEEAEETAAAIEAAGGRALALRADAAVRPEVEEAVARVAERLGRIDLLVNNIGVAKARPFLETDEAFWYQMVESNLMTALRFCHVVLPHMVRQRYGRIVSLSSVAGRLPRPNAVLYAVAKAGVIAMTRSLAAALADHDIRVNAVAPATIETAIARESRRTDPVFRQFAEDLTRAIVMKRWGQPEEVAAVVLFLLSDESSYMTGQTLSVDGGSCMP
jgi:NAD(P)-dependent dehydrogenase (short-subunit alcohol dehydrogenase family)